MFRDDMQEELFNTITIKQNVYIQTFYTNFIGI